MRMAEFHPTQAELSSTRLHFNRMGKNLSTRDRKEYQGKKREVLP
jgi:hypothetical protein